DERWFPARVPMGSRLLGPLLPAAPLDEVAQAVRGHTPQPPDVYGLDRAAVDELVHGAAAHGQAAGGVGDAEHDARGRDDLDVSHGNSPSRSGCVVFVRARPPVHRRTTAGGGQRAGTRTVEARRSATAVDARGTTG